MYWYIYTLYFFYYQLDSGVRAQSIENLGRFDGSKLLSCCLFSYVFIHKKAEKINLSKNHTLKLLISSTFEGSVA